MTKMRIVIGGLAAVVILQGAALAILLGFESQPATTLTVAVTSARVPVVGVDGHVVVFRAGEHEVPVANGSVAEALALAPGTYDLRVALTGAAAAPTAWHTGVEIGEGTHTEVSVEVPVGELTASVDAPASSTVMFEVFAGGDHNRVVSAIVPGERILLSPGRYDVRAVLVRDTREEAVRWAEDVEVNTGLLTAPSFTFPRSQVRIRATANGVPVEADAVAVTVYRAGDDMLEIVEKGTADVPIDLAPGTYRVDVRLLSAADEPTHSLGAVELAEAQTVENDVDFATAILHTEASLAGVERLVEHDVYVYVYAPREYEQAITYAPAGRPIMLSAGTYDLRANYFRSADQPDVWRRDVELGAGGEHPVRFEFASGKLLIRAFDASGEELLGDNAIVRIYTDRSAPAPVATARGGEIQVLSAGTYDVAVEDTRNVRVHWLVDTNVSAGKLTERMLTD